MLRDVLSKDHLCWNPTGFAYGKPAFRLTLSPKILTYGKSFKMAISTLNRRLGTKIMTETSYELLMDNQKKKLSKNNESKMTLYNTLPLKEAKVMAIEEAKYLAILPLDELVGNLKVYEMILVSDGVASKFIKEKVMPVALKANVTSGKTSNDSVRQDGSDEDKDKEEEFNSIVKNLWKLFNKGNRFKRENRFGNGGDSKNHIVDDYSKAKMEKALVGET
nr:hypothetical protein [Tanacetum cinerariifolium]GEW44635.1 hypothetical protein [Tanacetum cinerariifolium]